MSYFLCDARCFVFSFARFRLGTSPPRGTAACATFPFRVGFRLLSRPTRHDGSLREGFDFGFPCLRACVLLQFVFFRLAPPRHADDTREGFDGGWSCHSALSSRPPRYTGGTRQVLTDGLPSNSVCVSFNYFLGVFPGFIARTFRGVGVGFEKPHLRFMV